jgi:hypothetical protein
MGNDISADIPDILESSKFHWDLFGNFCNVLSTTDASGIYVAKFGRSAKTADYTMTTSDVYLVLDGTSATVTLTLLASASAGAGRILWVKCLDVTNAVTIDGNAAETIDGSATFSFKAANEAVALVSDGTNWEILWKYQPSTTTLPRSYLSGLGMSNDTDAGHDILVAVGECNNSDNTLKMTLGTPITKQIDATWAAGDDAGGMNDGEAVGNNTTYHVHLLSNATGTSVDVGFDTSITAANLLADAAVVTAGLTKYRRIGSVITDGSANILAFSQIGDEFLYVVPIQDVDVSTLGAAETKYTLSVPLGIQVKALMNVMAYKAGTTSTVWVYADDHTSAAPSTTVAPLANISTAGTFRHFAALEIRTNTSQQVCARSTSATTDLNIVTLGWIDRRGRDD